MGRTGEPDASTGQVTDRWAENPTEAISRGLTPARATTARQASMVFSIKSGASCSTQPGRG